MALARWWTKARERWGAFWRSQHRGVRWIREFGVPLAFVLLFLGLAWGYTGQSFPSASPLVVVESGSMMHGPCLMGQEVACETARFRSPPFGRVGTIDPGDLVFVKRVDAPADVEVAFGPGRRGGYGGHGDVVVYRPAPGLTPIIHRAMAYVEVSPAGCVPNAAMDPCIFRIPAACGAEFPQWVRAGDPAKYCGGSSEPITLRLVRGGLDFALADWPCPAPVECSAVASGFFTKGDNNGEADQVNGIARGPVTLTQIVGKARGEIPWFGLVKLSATGNEATYHCREGQTCGDPTRGSQWTIFRATAPWDVWLSLVLLVVLVVGASVAWGRWKERRGRES